MPLYKNQDTGISWLIENEDVIARIEADPAFVKVEESKKVEVKQTETSSDVSDTSKGKKPAK